MSKRNKKRHEAVRRETSLDAPARRREAVKAAPIAKHRDTFRVARAHREIATKLPDVIEIGSKKRLDQGAAKRSPSRVSAVQRLDQGAAKRSPSRVSRGDLPRVDAREVNLDRPTCKARPDGRRRSGSGTSRAFVPWCRRR